MRALIKKITLTWDVGNGKQIEVTYDGEGKNVYENSKILQSFSRPFKEIKKSIYLQSNEVIDFWIDGAPNILPDKSGFLVIFGGNMDSEFFCVPPPNNAAIFNADGSLRFLLKNPHGEQGHFRAVTNTTAKDGSPALGVRACPKDWPVCESVYLVDGSTDDLSQQIPKWIRD